ncbi:alpha/beta-hydrolase [Marasmius fiardii PR-910]|nr:alpha/beta-hydrolase [Marasmius fiardii PR-910]
MSSSSNAVLAGPPGDCCVTGVKHSGTPVGKRITIADVPTYFVEPKEQTSGRKRVLIFYADVWGPFFPNNQLIQDYFADHGFIVVGIDYFLGDPVYLHNEEAGFNRDAWMAKSKAQAARIHPAWLEAVRQKYGPSAKYSAVGYCFGAPYAMDVAASDWAAAAAFAHPAFLNEDHFRNIKKPLLLSCAEEDHTFSLASRRKAEDILIDLKATYTIQVFGRVAHGFAVRGDPEVGDTRWAKEESARGVIEWFKRFSPVDTGKADNNKTAML